MALAAGAVLEGEGALLEALASGEEIVTVVLSSTAVTVAAGAALMVSDRPSTTFPRKRWRCVAVTDSDGVTIAIVAVYDFVMEGTVSVTVDLIPTDRPPWCSVCVVVSGSVWVSDAEADAAPLVRLALPFVKVCCLKDKDMSVVLDARIWCVALGVVVFQLLVCSSERESVTDAPLRCWSRLTDVVLVQRCELDGVPEARGVEGDWVTVPVVDGEAAANVWDSDAACDVEAVGSPIVLLFVGCSVGVIDAWSEEREAVPIVPTRVTVFVVPWPPPRWRYPRADAVTDVVMRVDSVAEATVVNDKESESEGDLSDLVRSIDVVPDGVGSDIDNERDISLVIVSDVVSDADGDISASVDDRSTVSDAVRRAPVKLFDDVGDAEVDGKPGEAVRGVCVSDDENELEVLPPSRDKDKVTDRRRFDDSVRVQVVLALSDGVSWLTD